MTEKYLGNENKNQNLKAIWQKLEDFENNMPTQEKKKSTDTNPVLNFKFHPSIIYGLILLTSLFQERKLKSYKKKKGCLLPSQSPNQSALWLFSLGTNNQQGKELRTIFYEVLLREPISPAFYLFWWYTWSWEAYLYYSSWWKIPFGLLTKKENNCSLGIRGKVRSKRKSMFLSLAVFIHRLPPKDLGKALIAQSQLWGFSPLATASYGAWESIPGRHFLLEDGAAEEKERCIPNVEIQQNFHTEKSLSPTTQ